MTMFCVIEIAFTTYTILDPCVTQRSVDSRK